MKDYVWKANQRIYDDGTGHIEWEKGIQYRNPKKCRF